MKNNLFSVLCVLAIAVGANAQVLDGYNTIYLKSHTNNQWGVDDRIRESFAKKGLTLLCPKLKFQATAKEDWRPLP